MIPIQYFYILFLFTRQQLIALREAWHWSGGQITTSESMGLHQDPLKTLLVLVN
jgi:hypothetical protein